MGLIKLVLALQHDEIPPHLLLREINPHIALDMIPAAIPVARTPWLSGEGRRIAGLSSFGLGGTNAHVVVEEAPIPELRTAEVDRPPMSSACRPRAPVR